MAMEVLSSIIQLFTLDSSLYYSLQGCNEKGI